MNRFKKFRHKRILSNNLWLKTGSKKWLGPIFAKTENGIHMTIAKPAILAFHVDSKYIKFFKFNVTHPKPEILENLPDFQKKGKHPQKSKRSYWKSLNWIHRIWELYHRGFKLQSLKCRISPFFPEEISSIHVHLFCFFPQGWLYQTEGPW